MLRSDFGFRSHTQGCSRDSLGCWGLPCKRPPQALSLRPQGLFDNFLRMRLRDPGLGSVCAALDWLAFDDLLQRAALHSQSYQLLRYPPFLPAAFHVLFASSHVPRIAFPSSQQEVRVWPGPAVILLALAPANDHDTPLPRPKTGPPGHRT